MGALLQNMGIDFGGLHICVAQLLLYRADIRTRLQWMRGEGMAQGVAAHRLHQARLEGRPSQQFVDARLVIVMTAKMRGSRFVAEPR